MRRAALVAAVAAFSVVVIVPATAPAGRRSYEDYRYGRYAGKTREGLPISFTVARARNAGRGKITTIKWMAKLRCLDRSSGTTRSYFKTVTVQPGRSFGLSRSGRRRHAHGAAGDVSRGIEKLTFDAGSVHARAARGLVFVVQRASRLSRCSSVNGVASYTARWKGPRRAGVHSD